ncbi:SDR family NAD(P)-dependent oxidoreductase [Akkermansia sp.]|uniref:SDR family NAD(P)-dependent oxidoreductase n=1 Tax=Akkermansia sp. TaxID=1872421 RepID=UPI0025C4DD87|nr:SDR family NAD(P)-dependent oxidoreductase [Akkermansia sp.]
MKKAIIIGATSGIGKALAKTLINDNYKVGITGRRTELLNELKAENTEKYYIQTLDVADTERAIEAIEKLVEELGGLDLLIISSGTGDINKTLDFQIEKRTIDVNVTGFTSIADWTFNFFEKQKYGHLVVISSVAGLRGEWQAPSYNATKAYQINYAEALRKKAKKVKSQIFVTDIRPGFVNTDMAKGEGLFWVANVDKAVKQIYSAIRRKKRVAYITKRWCFVAMILKRLPNFIYDKM